MKKECRGGGGRRCVSVRERGEGGVCVREMGRERRG